MNSPLPRLEGGLIARDTSLDFSFNGRDMKGHAGDTLASALLANDVHLVARSFKYHRPRGIFSLGSEEPSALVSLHEGARTEPNSRATTTELTDGLIANPQNYRGSLNFDLMAANDLLARFIGAGFYYKTFMWPKSFWEKLYEPVIRSAAGLGALSGKPDPDCYDKGYRHCDLLVVGAGPSGLAAALAAARSGLRVIIADEDFLPGGRLNLDNLEIDNQPGARFAADTAAELRSMQNVQLMTRSTVFGCYDHGICGVLENRAGAREQAGEAPRQIFWTVYAKRVLLCGGASERSIAFANNDRPGIMLAGAVRGYANRFAVACGRRIAVFTNNDDGWKTAQDLRQKGVEVAAIVDTREQTVMAARSDIGPAYLGQTVVQCKGRKRLRAITLSGGAEIAADCLAVSGGWSPNIQLSCHHRARPVWNDNLAAFTAGGDLPDFISLAGSANGVYALGAVLKSGHEAGLQIAEALGKRPTKTEAPQAEDEPAGIKAFWHVEVSRGRAFIDLQHDVTVKDVALARQEGFKAAEHLKRYTTLGMATDQGRTSNTLGLAVMAQMEGRTIGEIGTTIYRPPYMPVSIGAFAGRARERHYRPTHYVPSHGWAERHNAVFVEAGHWLRPQYYPQPGESHWRESVDREVLQTRKSVGICDVSTLGKVDIQGRDTTEFVNFLYANPMTSLKVGKTRYGLMLREDGLMMDDGTIARLAENHYLATTSTAHAQPVLRHMEYCHQVLCPQLDVHLTSVTGQFAQYAIAGPNSRRLLEKIIDPDFDLSNEAFPHLGCANITLCGGVAGRLFRISFSGELAYELAVPARYGESLFASLIEAGAEFDVCPYGVEALGVMRIEKGHAAGSELCGHITARDLGMGRWCSSKKDYVGHIMRLREELNREDGLRLVGLKPRDSRQELSAGAHIIAQSKAPTTANDEGWITSAAYSPVLGHSIALGFVRRGDERYGEIVIAADPLRNRENEVEISPAVFVDPKGERVHG